MTYIICYAKLKIMYKKSSSSVKFSSSINNLMFLCLLGFSIFIIYRYVKSLENELKNVKSDLMAMKNTNQVEAVLPPTVVEAPPVCSLPVIERRDEPQEEDLESVASEEIMKIVDEIDEGEQVDIGAEQVTIENDTEVEDDIVLTKTDNDLSRKTNEELKKILKEQGKNTKGTKAELIKRITEEA